MTRVDRLAPSDPDPQPDLCPRPAHQTDCPDPEVHCVEGDNVLDSVIMAFWDEDNILDHIYLYFFMKVIEENIKYKSNLKDWMKRVIWKKNV